MDVLRQVLDRGQQLLGQQIHSDDLVDLIQLADDVQADVGELIFEQGEKHGEELVDGLILAHGGRQAHDARRQRRAHVLGLITRELLDPRHDLRPRRLGPDELHERGDVPRARDAHLRLVIRE